MKKQIITKVRELNDKDLMKIVDVFDWCIECWNLKDSEKCKYQMIRKKIGLGECKALELKNKKRIITRPKPQDIGKKHFICEMCREIYWRKTKPAKCTECGAKNIQRCYRL